MWVGVIGPLHVHNGECQVPVAAGKQRIVLATLALRANRAIPLDELTDSVWSGHPPRAAEVTLRNYVKRLREALGPAAGRLVTRNGGYLLQLETPELDLALFEDLCRQGSTAVGDRDWPRAQTILTRTLRIWRGVPLLDVPSPGLRDELVPHLEQLRLQAVEDHAEAELHLGHHDRLVPRLRDLAASHPLRERFHAQLVLALARCGRQAEALEAYQAARRALVEALGIEPGPELRRLQERILAGDTGLVTAPAGQPGTLAGPDNPVPRQLPAGVRHFTGRQDELDVLTSLLAASAPTAPAGGTVVISAIDGMAGVGKTALAIHAAHELAGRFPDGQLFIDLHGYTQGYSPRSADEALEALLRALGMPPQRIPRDTEQRAALYRQRLAGTRTLILLDNATGEAQVRPLLPGAASCLVLITSRRRLKGLYDAHPVALDVLPEADAVTLLHVVAGPARVPAGDPALAEIAELCGRLPLALRIAAALLRHRPTWALGHLAALLRNQRQQRITALSDGERDLSTVFDLSYTNLTGAQRHLFRHLGLLPGPDTDAYAAAALTGTDSRDATRLLEELVDHNLLIPDAGGRYHLHDLLRDYAATLAADDPAADRRAALERLLDYYQNTSCRADALITSYARHAPNGPAPAHAPALADPKAAWTWLRAERPNLLAALRHTTTHACHERSIILTSGLTTLLRTDGPWTQAAALHAAAADAAQRHGLRLDQAQALTALGGLRGLMSDFPDAARDLRQALWLYREVGDRQGQATALIRLGNERRLTGDLPGATRDLHQALRLCRELDDRQGQATALIRLGYVRRMAGDHPGATGDFQEALRLCRELDDRLGQGNALSDLGELRGMTGDHQGATRDLREALNLYRDLGDRLGEGNALIQLGNVRRLAGDHPAALRDLREGLDQLRRIGARANEAWGLNHYAASIRATGEHAHALTVYRDALRLARETGQPDDEAIAVEGIGECHLDADDTDAGIAHLEQALCVFQRLAMNSDAERVQARLSQLAQGLR